MRSRQSTMVALRPARILTSWLLVVALSINLATLTGGEVCLYAPFVTSVQKTEIMPPTQPGNISDLLITLDIGYGTFMEIKNLSIDNSTYPSKFISNNSYVNFLGLYPGIYYANDPVDARGSVFVNKSTVVSASRQKISGRRSVMDSGIWQSCNAALIYHASFVRRMKIGQFLYVRYYKRTRCSSTFSDSPQNYFLYLGSSETVSAAAFYEPYLFEYESDGFLTVFQYLKEADMPNETHPMGVNSVIVYSGWLVWQPDRTRAPRSSSPSLINSRLCLEALNKLSLEGAIADEYAWSAPYRTISRWGSNLYFAIEPGRLGEERAVAWSRMHLNMPFQRSITSAINLGINAPPELFVIDAMTVYAPDPTRPELLRGHFFLSHKTMWSTIYLVNWYVGPPREKTVGPDPQLKYLYNFSSAPDDINYWSSCEMIVSIYGYIYALHHYWDNIIQAPANLNLLDDKLFDYPIEAMTSEGDEFWFFTKMRTVQVMTAESGDCSVLRFNSKLEVELRQVFGHTPKNVFVENRYFDGVRWIPPWEKVVNLSPKRGLNTLVWLAILGGGAVAVIVLIALVIALIRMSGSGRPGNVIYALSNSRHELSKDPPTASTLPLFSQHDESQFKTVQSSGSRDERRSASKETVRPRRSNKSTLKRSPRKPSKKSSKKK